MSWNENVFNNLIITFQTNCIYWRQYIFEVYNIIIFTVLSSMCIIKIKIYISNININTNSIQNKKCCSIINYYDNIGYTYLNV